MRIRTGVAFALPLATALAVGTTTPAHAKSGDVRKAGSCTTNSTWKLKASPDDGQIEAEFEVDSNVVGQTWKWRLVHNGDLAASGTAKTVAPSGSFTVKRFVNNAAGVDTIRGRAKNPTTGEICVGTVKV
ncbi:MAG: hypothetical protein JO246_17260 [Frankiaceae bacterium]|nr:hypothetical protein [Frankiaceae bacterium]MBV9872506.1 hypothetical protein [Frankiaceae bacterium]